MVPVSAFAAVVAIAGPQRMAAESSMNEAAADMATLVVAWRDREPLPAGPIEAFPPECDSANLDLVASCNALFETFVADLGNLGVDVFSLRGYYSDSLTTAVPPAGDPPPLPCGIPNREVVFDAALVAMAADWYGAGWATAQVWPDGLRLGGEAIGRLSVIVDETTFAPDNPRRPVDCGTSLEVVDKHGVPGWLATPVPDLMSRDVLQSVPGRTPFSG